MTGTCPACAHEIGDVQPDLASQPPLPAGFRICGWCAEPLILGPFRLRKLTLDEYLGLPFDLRHVLLKVAGELRQAAREAARQAAVAAAEAARARTAHPLAFAIWVGEGLPQLHAGRLAAEAAKVLGGRGGGTATRAQGWGQDPSRWPAACARIEVLVQEATR